MFRCLPYNITLLCVFVSFGGAWNCWYPDGVTFDNVGQAPCNATLANTTQGSACCNPRDACTTSGMCLGESGFTYRGTCTDRTFASDNCPSLCHIGRLLPPFKLQTTISHIPFRSNKPTNIQKNRKSLPLWHTRNI